MKFLFAAVLLCLGVSAQAIEPSYLSVSTWTLGGTGTQAFAFQNKSTTRDVAIKHIEILPTSGGTVTSGPVNFWIVPSTVMTHGGTSQVSASSRQSPNWSAPSWVYASTGPVGVTYEGKGSRQLPIGIIPVNPDESSEPRATPVPGITEFDDEIILPKGSNRGIVIEQKQYGATDWTAGTVMIRVTYTLR